MDFLQTIGKRIRARRHALGMSQEALAERAGLHYTYIGQIERGEKNLTIESLSKITLALGIPLSQLLEKVDGPERPGSYALQAYELFFALSPKRQKELYQILDAISRYGKKGE